MADELGELVGKGFAILKRRIVAVEDRKPVDGIDGADGKDGLDGKRGPQGATGDVGPQGDDGPQGDAGGDGVDGSDGERGQDGIDGIDGTNGNDGADGRDGSDGRNGTNGIDGTQGERGQDGIDGESGVGVDTAQIDKRGHLIITLDDGRKIDAGKVKGKDAVQFQGMIAGGPPGGATSALKWTDYATGFSAEPTLTETIATGDVYTYTYSNGTLYRLAPSGSEHDAFYSTFTGGVLGGLVAQKGITI